MNVKFTAFLSYRNFLYLQDRTGAKNILSDDPVLTEKASKKAKTITGKVT